MEAFTELYPALKYVGEYERDDREECKACKGNCGYVGMAGVWACQGFVPKNAPARTNADRIRNMTDKELAAYLSEISLQGRCPCPSNMKHHCADMCVVQWHNWLEKETE